MLGLVIRQSSDIVRQHREIVGDNQIIFVIRPEAV